VQTVQTARTETSDRRAIKAIRVRKAMKVIKVTKVLTASLHPIKALLSHWHSLQQPLRRIQRRRRQPPAGRLGQGDPLETTELLAPFLVQRVRRDPLDALAAWDALAALALQDLPTLAYKPSRG
jgi:hypothetical protein